MNHEIDLSKYEIRTDLAIESIQSNVNRSVIKDKDVTITSIKLSKAEGLLVDKKAGNYITIEFDDVTDHNNLDHVKKIFTKYLKKLMKDINIGLNYSGLIIGLGNDKSTPDAIGPMSISKIMVTSHLFALGEVEAGFRSISAINPGVMGETGIETASLVKSIVKTVKPDFVVVIDALKSGSIDRVNRTIQITDTGIHPGSGVGNKRKEISFDTIGVPVIAVGVPTVVDLVTIVSDTVGYMYKHFSYMFENINKPSSKLKPSGSINYLKEEVTTKIDKVNLLGIVGSLTDEEVKQLFFEVLTPIGYNLIVTPKDIDFLVLKLSDIIGNGINAAMHTKVNNL